jgi:membrane protease YdiL (CAAX protease family)
MNGPGSDLRDAPARDPRAALRGFGGPGVLAVLLIVAAGMVGPLPAALLVLAWVAVSRTPWRAIGYVRPRSWPRTILLGIGIGAAFKLVMKTLVMPLTGAPPRNAAFHFLVHDQRALAGLILASLIAGFAEETLYRGWMFERLGRVLGQRIAARVGIVIVTSVLFGLAHLSGQGVPGAEQAVVTGALFGALYMVTGALPLIMIIHASFDLTAAAIIFMGWETRLAHAFFH